jgi:uncharacterized tellurite resistance protein B-like protein
MITSLKRLFSEPSSRDPASDLRLAGAILMIEVACADFQISESERSQLEVRLRERFGLPKQTLRQLIGNAMQQHDLAVSLHEQIALINSHYAAADKRQLMHDLWSIAYADGELHHYEEGVIRRLADLLYVPHKDFLQTKHEVSGQT